MSQQKYKYKYKYKDAKLNNLPTDASNRHTANDPTHITTHIKWWAEIQIELQIQILKYKYKVFNLLALPHELTDGEKET